MRVIVAITAASGQIYASQVVELLAADNDVEQIAIVYSSAAREVANLEGISIAPSAKIVEYDNTDMFAPIASGSAAWDAMVVVPCSVGTMSRIATGLSDSLITRAADVMLKERRRLVVVVRETPLSLIHLRNMCALTEAGGIVMPASPNFYGTAQDLNALTLTVSRRVVSILGARGEVEAWDGKKKM